MKALALDAATYARHELHADACAWVEKNCYVDVWIELVHALGCDPHAMLPFVVALDFEGDQWTFFKPPHGELWELYGLDVQELNVWRPLVDHAAEHLAAGKLIASEADAFWLPDVAGTDYRRAHVKSTIILNELDVAGKRLGYFHNASYYALDGEDFERTFAPPVLPLYAELARVDRVVRRPHAELAAISGGLLARHLARRPCDNPVRRFAARFAAELSGLQEAGLAHYHAWAFATVRQLGAAAELAALYLRWLAGAPDAGQLELAAVSFRVISSAAKAFIMKGARAVSSKKPFDATSLLDPCAEAWDTAIATLVNRAD
ncbi:MAG TPA: DUF1839 family protein [Kofleriaceae bacterium]